MHTFSFSVKVINSALVNKASIQFIWIITKITNFNRAEINNKIVTKIDKYYNVKHTKTNENILIGLYLFCYRKCMLNDQTF